MNFAQGGAGLTIICHEADIALGLAELMRLDPRLIPVVDAAGPVPLRLRAAGFSGLAHIIVSQMISRASAEAIWRRMTYGGNELTAEEFLAAGTEAWRGYGLSGAKAKSLAALAEAVAAGNIDLFDLGTLDASQAVQKLTAVKGVGPWTAEVYLMFCCGHQDLFPVGDVALQNAVAAGLCLTERPKPALLASMARAWSPWRSVAARLFWAYYSAKLGRGVLPVA